MTNCRCKEDYAEGIVVSEKGTDDIILPTLLALSTGVVGLA
jgi:hypothetical protein